LKSTFNFIFFSFIIAHICIFHLHTDVTRLSMCYNNNSGATGLDGGYDRQVACRGAVTT